MPDQQLIDRTYFSTTEIAYHYWRTMISAFSSEKNKIPSANMFHQRPVGVATKRSKALTSSFKNVGGRKNWIVGYLKYVGLRHKLFYVHGQFMFYE